MTDSYSYLSALDILAPGGVSTAAPGGYAYRNQWRFNRSDAIGGVVSSRKVVSLQIERYGPFLRGGIRIDRVGGANGEGFGTLEAVDTTHLRWTAPGESAGESIEIAYGETKHLPCGTGNIKWIKVTRTDAEAMWGSEQVRLSIVANNEIAGDRHLVEPNPWADTSSYGCVYLKNNYTSNITSIVVTPNEGTTYVGWNAVSDDLGANIPDQNTDPGLLPGQDFDDAWSVGGALTPGSSIQLWFRRTSVFVDDGGGLPDISMCTTRWVVSAQLSYSVDGNTVRDDVYGITQRGIASLARYELWQSIDAPEIDFSDPGTFLVATDDDPEHFADDVGMAGDITVIWQILYRDKYGQREIERDISNHTYISASLEIAPSAPGDPVVVSVNAKAGGVMNVMAMYDIGVEQSLVPATSWLLYIRTDGTEPDFAIDTPVEVSMDRNALMLVMNGGIPSVFMLDYDSDPIVDETPFKVKIKMKREYDSVTLYSPGTISYSGTAQWYGSQMGVPIVSELSGGSHQTGPDDIGETMTVSEPCSAYLITTDHGTEFWANGDCVWSLRPDQWRHAYACSIEAITGSALTTEPVEIGTWDGSAKEVFINVAGQHVALIECISKTIRFAQYVEVGVPHERNASAPVWPCYAHTCFQVYNGITGKWETPMSVDSSGILTLDVPSVACSEGDCLS